MITLKQVSFGIIKIAKYLKASNINKPILQQFAVFVKAAKKCKHEAKQRNLRILEKEKGMDELIESVSRKLQEINTLINILDSFLYTIFS